MSGILTRARLIAQERYDLEDLIVDQNATKTDAKFWTKQFLSNSNYILKGFQVTGLGLKAATVLMANATLIHPENTFDFSWFTSEESPSDIIVPDASLQDGSKNYLELRIVEETNTPVTKAFWDPAANSGEGAEFNQEIDTVTDLAIEVVASTGGFSGDPDRIKLAIIEVDGSGNIVGILDKRDLFFGLNQDFTWASRIEPEVTLTLSSVTGTFIEGETITFGGGATAVLTQGGTTSIKANQFSSDSFSVGDSVTSASANGTLDNYSEAFAGSEKDIDNFKEALDATWTEIKAIKGTQYWPQQATGSLTGLAKFINSTLVQESAAISARWAWDGSDLTLTDDNGTPSATDILGLIKFLGESQLIQLSRQDGQDSSTTISIADNEVLYITLPDSGDRVYNDIGGADTNFKVIAADSFIKNDSNYWLAYREGGKLYIKGYGELEPGEEAQIGDPISLDILTFIGATDETDSDPNYSSSDVVTQGAPLTTAIGELDLEVSTIATNYNQDRNSKLVEGGTWSVVDNSGTLEVTLSEDAYIEIGGISLARNTISAQTISLPNATSVAYIDLLREDGPAVLRPITIVDNDAIVLDDSKLIIARRVSDGVLIGRSFLINDGEFLELDGALAEINRYFGSFRLVPHESNPKQVRITGGDTNKLSGSILSSATINKLVDFEGAVVDFSTGNVFESDGVTALNNSFIPATIAANQFRWYSLTLTAGSVNADNTVGFEVNIIEAGSDGASADAAPRANFIDGVGVGQLFVQESAGDIADIVYENIVQLGIIGGAAVSAAGGTTVQKDDVLQAANVSILNFKGDSVEVDIPAPGQADVIIDDATSARVIRSLRAGEALIANRAVYPKYKKIVEFTASDNVIETSEGSITIDVGEYIYPYSNLKTQLETKLNALGSVVFEIIVQEEGFKISASSGFTINKVATNSATTKLGLATVDTSSTSSFFRASARITTTVEPMWFHTNTDDDLDPPTLDDGLFTTNVPANHRSRSFSGFILSAANALDTIKIYTGGSLSNFSGLTEDTLYYINGTSGQINSTSVTNSLEVGEAIFSDRLFFDPILKDFEYQAEPDTDMEPNSVDGVFLWEDLPQIPTPQKTDTALYDMSGNDNIVVAQVSTATTAELVVSYSIDNGTSFKKATFNGSTQGPATGASSSWALSDFHTFSPSVVVSGNKVFVAYCYWTGTLSQIRGLYGTIDANGNLDLKQTNANASSPYINTISDTGAGDSRNCLRAFERNNVLIVTYKTAVTSGQLLGSSSFNFGASFEGEGIIFNNASAPQMSTASATDTQPYHLRLVDEPSQDSAPDDTQLITNGTFNTDLTGWTSIENGAASTVWNNNRMLSTWVGVSDQTGGMQAITCEIGNTYELSFNSYDVGQANCRVQIASNPYTNGDVHSAIAGEIYSQSHNASEDDYKITIRFTATATTMYLLFSGNSGAGHEFDNVEVTEVLRNRVCLVTGAGVTNFPGSTKSALFYTDNDLMDASTTWSTAIDLATSTPLGAAHHLPIGSYYDETNDLWYLQYISGHNSDNGVGGTARTGNTSQFLLIELDITQATPTITNSGVFDTGFSNLTTQNGSGADNNNGVHFFQMPKRLIKDGNDNIISTLADDSGAHLLFITTDMSDVANATEQIMTNDYANDDILEPETQFAKTSSQLHMISKLGIDSYGDSLAEGKVIGRQLEIDTSAKTEQVTNGTFDTDISNWTDTGSGLTWNASQHANYTQDSSNFAYQLINTIPGKIYNVSFHHVDSQGGITGIFEIRFDPTDLDGVNTNSHKRYIQLVTDSNNGDTFKFSFIARDTQTIVNFGVQAGGGTSQFDSITVQEASIQFDKTYDLIDKPNIDEEDFAGYLKIYNTDDTINISSLATKDTEGTDIVQVATNNIGFKSKNVITAFEQYPIEMLDSQSSDTTLHGMDADGDNVVIVNQANSGIYNIFVSTDKGQTFKKVDFIDTPTAADNNTDYFFGNPKVSVNGDDVVITNISDDGINAIQCEAYYGTITSDGYLGLTKSVGQDSNNALIDLGASTFAYNLSIARSGSQVVVHSNTGPSGASYICISDDDGATFGTKIRVKSGVSDATGDVNAPSMVGITPGGRIFVIDNQSGGNEATVFYYTDDDGVTWETAIEIINQGSGQDVLFGYGQDGIRLGVLTYNSTVSAANIDLTVCTDLDAGTPLFSLTGEVAVGSGDVQTANGYSSGSATLAYNKSSLHKIIWTSATSVMMTWAVVGSSDDGIRAVKIYDISDITNSLVSIDVEEVDSDGQFTEPQIVKNANDEIFVIYKDIASGQTISNNLTRGRILTKRIYDSSPTTSDTHTQSDRMDISQSVITNFAGRVQVVPGYSIASFEMDNALGFEGLFFNGYIERFQNDQIEAFAKIPINIVEGLGVDSTSHHVARKGDIVATTQVSTSSSYCSVSIDGGKTFITVRSGDPASTGTLTDATITRYTPFVHITDSDTILFALRVFLNGSATGQPVRIIRCPKVNGAYSASDVTVIDVNPAGGNGNHTVQIKELNDDIVLTSIISDNSNSFDEGLAVTYSTDDGVSWSTTTVGSSNGVGTGANQINVYEPSTDNFTPYKLDLFDLGSGDTRLCLFMTRSGAEPTLLYSDDLGANWETQISLGATNEVIIGYGRSGNSTLTTMFTSDAQTTKINRIEDMTVSTPVTDGTASILTATLAGLSNGLSTSNFGSGSRAMFRHQMKNLIYDGTSAYLAIAVDGPSTYHHGDLVKIDDVTNIAATTTIARFGVGVASTKAIEDAVLVKGDSGQLWIVYKFRDSAISNNLTEGRILALKYFPDTDEFGNELDIGFKADTSTGGFAGNIRLSEDGTTISILKDNGSGFASQHINILKLR